MLHTSKLLTSPTHLKRKATNIDSLIEEKFPAKSEYQELINLENEFDDILKNKQLFLKQQKLSSLLVKPRVISEPVPLNRLCDLFYRATNLEARTSASQHLKILLMQKIVQESIFIEWPRTILEFENTNHKEILQIDCAPLIHRARNVVKCRSSHPTFRVKVCAINQVNNCPKLEEVLFRASLVKLSPDISETRQIAGRIILTQREGIVAPRTTDHSGVFVDNEGRVVISQSFDCNAHLLRDKYYDNNLVSGCLKFENGVLCATFPEIGVALNSMIDRRQLATRYALKIEVSLIMENSFVVQHTVHSHPFLIAITNDQTEPLLCSIFWQRMLCCDSQDIPDIHTELPPVQWEFLRKAIENFVKVHCNIARALAQPELFHVQAMLLFPRVLHCHCQREFDELEKRLFDSITWIAHDFHASEKRIAHLKTRLLSEPVKFDVEVEKNEFMQNKCVSLLDMKTRLDHSVWQWLFKATDIIVDIGHKMCPLSQFDRKCSKNKKQFSAEDNLSLASLFNKNVITFVSAELCCTLMQSFEARCSFEESAMMLRFCDENVGNISIAFTNNGKKLMFGSISTEHIKDFKQGLPEVLMDEMHPSKFSKIISVNFGNEKVPEIFILQKNTVFANYKTKRQSLLKAKVNDDSIIRINPLSGEILSSANTTDIFANNNYGFQKQSQLILKTENGDNDANNAQQSSSFLNPISFLSHLSPPQMEYNAFLNQYFKLSLQNMYCTTNNKHFFESTNNE